jgi:hypothetical protein
MLNIKDDQRANVEKNAQSYISHLENAEDLLTAAH